MVTVTVKASPLQPVVVATGTTVYTTSTAAAVVFVHASFAISESAKPVPVIGVPAEAVKPFEFILVMLYVATVGVFASVAKVTPVALSLHTVVV